MPPILNATYMVYCPLSDVGDDGREGQGAFGPGVVLWLERRELLILFKHMNGIANVLAAVGKPDSCCPSNGMPAVRAMASCGVVRLA
ncbi:MAG: hypothetical protein ACM3MH_02940 [Actinomycetota bacterium]